MRGDAVIGNNGINRVSIELSDDFDKNIYKVFETKNIKKYYNID